MLQIQLVVNVTIKDGNSRAVVSPFPLPANDVRSIQGPVMFYDGIKVSASVTECYIVVGGQ
ncbi:hypothetical protein ACFW0L_16525 [Priestia megaterium]|uniref:hypothetical protein n=1 Tax=Priestia megaterium TaxID=1404 RepID=UPI0013FBD2BE|nr:hypothetical protein [Priestia megaterium]MCA4155874.1 hypothetical protein [Priestia megaterium]NGY72441.1 hypothetical protein [Priestia megaterium]